MIISTGMANIEEIQEAVDTTKSMAVEELILLHCISSYPAPIDQCHLTTIQDLAQRFNCLSGLSDHSLGNTVACAASALGACFIEKHVTLDRSIPGPDASFSIEPSELLGFAASANQAWQAVGNVNYDRKPAEKENLKFRRSLYFVKPIKKGETITENHIKRIRPGFGLEPKYYDDLIGKNVNKTFDQVLFCM